MKKNIHYITIAAAFVAVAAMIIGCKPNVSAVQDTTAPAEVTELKAVAGNGKISLSWVNPADADLHQVEISATPAAGTLANSVYLFAEKGKAMSFTVEGLSNGTAYTFTVKTIDKTLNKSKGVKTEKSITPSGTGDKTPPQGGGGTGGGGGVMSITLTQSPAKETKTNSSVTVTVASSTSIKDAKWKKGEANAKTVLESGTAITDKRFTVSENSIYSVAVLDNDGRREVETIKIENIDKTPPAKVTGLAANYSATAQKITVNWQNPTNSDFAGLTLSWKKEGGETTNVPLETSNTSYEISNIATDGSTYTITVITKDDVENTSTPEEKTVKATATAEITEVMLNRTHLDTKMTDRGIVVTITGSNFDKLTSLLVQVTDGSTSQPPVPATIDASNNKATATVQAPIPSDPTDEGTRYTVKAIVNSTAPAAATASFIVSNPAKVHNIALTPAQLKLGSATKVSVAVTGTNFDIRGETKIKLFNSDEAEVTASTKIVPAGEGTATNFSAEITLPNVDGIYTVAVYFNEVKESKTSILQLYSAPEIASVSIPKAGTGYAGNKLPVTITGKNFTAPGIKAVSFSGTPALSDIEIVSDTIVTAKVDCPYSAGETNLTVTCTPAEGSPVQESGKIIVKDYPAYTVGKIVLADNSLVEASNYSAIDPTNPPVGIICGSNSYKAPQMIAVHTSGSNLEWAAYNTTGYNTKFEGIICTPSQTGSGAAQTATFTGDTDGSDNWEYIKQQDPAGAADAATNYPAFNWVNTYNTTYADKLGIVKPAWYMPSLAELCEVYKNRDAINASLAKICDLGSDYAVSSLDGDSRYWSSSQVSNNKDYAWDVYFSNGDMGNYLKDKYYRVCCLAGF